MLSRPSRRDEEFPMPVTNNSLSALFMFWDGLDDVHVGHITRNMASQNAIPVSALVLFIEVAVFLASLCEVECRPIALCVYI